MKSFNESTITENTKILKIKARHEFTIFPKSPEVLGENGKSFGITKWQVTDVIDGDLLIGARIIIKGFFEEPIDDKRVYSIICKEIEDEKYGIQYEKLNLIEDIDFSKLEGQKSFLSLFLSEGQISEMYKALENPLQLIAEHNVEELKKVKGVGDYIANAIIDRFEKYRDNSKLYIAFDGLDLTENFISRLIQTYGNNPDTIIAKVKEAPYDLIWDMKGVGFKTADAIAIKVGIPPKSTQRIKGFIYYYLNTEGENGNSFVYASDLTAEIFYQFDGKENILETYTDENGDVIDNNINQAIHQMQEEGIIVLEENESRLKRRIYLKKYYELEKKITFHLNRLLQAENNFRYDNWEEIIKKQEEHQGWNFTQEQKDGIKLGLDNQVCFITGGAGCVDADTEFFTGKGWKRIADYQEGDKVLQYNEDGTASLVIPQRYIKEPCKELWHFETNYGVNQTVCDEHKIIYWSQKGKKHVCNINDIIEKQKNSISGWRGQFETIFKYNGKGVSYSDAEIRLMCAIIADGSFYSKSKEGTNSFLTCRFHIKKERKKQRLKMLFALNNLEYKEKQSQAEGYTDFYITAPVREKEFFSYWYDCNLHQLEVVCDEVLNWDGSMNTSHTGTIRRSFSSCSEATIDFIQFAFHNCGYKATKRQYDRRNREHKHSKYNYKSIEYVLTISSRHRIGLNYDSRPNRKTPKTMPQKVSTVDGYKYCFTVDSHMLILRRQGNIFITGNCGKSSLVSGILSVLGEYNFAQCSLAGKAAARLKEVTGEDGYTIHRLLGYSPLNLKHSSSFFTYNDYEKSPLPYDIIILDEISLIGGEIFLDLIKAIPSGAKLIMLGDMGQLESIGCLNLASDIYHSNVIPKVELTKVHRQAQKSGIITTSHLIRNSEDIFERGFEGEVVVGELQDMVLDIYSDSEQSLTTVIEQFIKWYNSDLVKKDIMKIQVISPVKERGDASVYKLNTEIQKIVNPQTEENLSDLIKVKVGEDKFVELRENDKILCVSNQYGLCNQDGVPVDIFNGWTGIIRSIVGASVEVYFPIIDEFVILSREQVQSTLTLGYAATCHKMQGSSNTVIIGVIDYTTPPQMRTKELLYTLVTRAEKLCVLVGQRGAIIEAIRKSGISNKQTFLCEMLREKAEKI